MWLDLPMEKTHPANDNLGLLQRHPRLLTEAHERGCSHALSKRELPKNPPSNSDVSLASRLSGIEHADMHLLTRDVNSRSELSSSGVDRHTLEPSSVPFADGTVSLVLSGSSETQIEDAIVRSIAVDVIDLPGGPTAVAVEPGQPMSAVVLPADHDQSVSGASSPCDISDLALRAQRPNAPPKFASFGVVVEKVSKFSGGNHLAKTHKGHGYGERSPESNREKNSEEDTGRELALINFRIEALNWIEFYLSKKRTAANDGQVGWPGRGGASKRI
jgi:hypothetical protein